MLFTEYVQSRSNKDHSYYMNLAIKAAERAASKGDTPVGAVLAWSESVLIDTNTVYSEEDFTNHAELNVMRKASETKFRKLTDAILYTTVEPCVMCTEAARLNGISHIFFGAYDTKNGCVSSKYRNNAILEEMEITGGILINECHELLPKRMREFILIERQQ